MSDLIKVRDVPVKISWSELEEKLAALCHSQWSGWMEYLFGLCSPGADGSVVIPRDLVERWTRQLGTEYEDLPENEKESDRIEARRILDILPSRGV